MLAIRRQRRTTGKPPLPSRRRASRAVERTSAGEVARTGSDSGMAQDPSGPALTGTPEAQGGGDLSASHDHTAATGGTRMLLQTSSVAASDKVGANDGPDETLITSAAVQAISPFVPRLLRDALAAAAPKLPSLAGLAGLQQLDMASVAKASCTRTVAINMQPARCPEVSAAVGCTSRKTPSFRAIRAIHNSRSPRLQGRWRPCRRWSPP